MSQPPEMTPYQFYLQHEHDATLVQSFQPIFIPGLLQTPDYAAALLKAVFPSQDASIRTVRMRRQAAAVSRSPRPRLQFIIDEVAVRRPPGPGNIDAAIMTHQLKSIFMRDWSEESLEVRVIPVSAGFHHGLRGSFVILSHGDPQVSTVYLEDSRGTNDVITSDDDVVSQYRARFTSLLDIALPTGESRRLISDAAASFYRAK